MLKINTFNLILKRVTCIIAIIATFIVSVCAIFYIFFIPTYVVGVSMQPTINSTTSTLIGNNDKIYINRFASANKNDIVVLKVAGIDMETSNGYIIKRLIAIENDCVDIKLNATTNDYELLVNNKVVYSRPYKDYYPTVSSFESYKVNLEDKSRLTDQGLKLTKGEVFLLGDNWNNSADSSLYGPFKVKDIVGRVDIIVQPNENDFVEILKYVF